MVGIDYYVTGLKALAAARDVSVAREKNKLSCRLAMGLVDEYAYNVRLVEGKLLEARSELVGSRWQVVTARLEAGTARRVAMARRARLARIARVARVARQARIARLAGWVREATGVG